MILHEPQSDPAGAVKIHSARRAAAWQMLLKKVGMTDPVGRGSISRSSALCGWERGSTVGQVFATSPGQALIPRASAVRDYCFVESVRKRIGKEASKHSPRQPEASP